MKRLSTLALLSVMAGLMGCPAQAQIAGSVMIEDMGPRDYPPGYNETGRYERFIQDARLTDLNLKNRDFEDWKPLDAASRQIVRHFLHGKANTSDTRVPDQEIGRYIPVIEDRRLEANNMEFNDRMFYGYQIPSPYTAQASSALAKSYLRGLPVGTNLGVAIPRDATLPVTAAPRLLYFWQ